MRCIFCKSSSADSRSTEHIVPESLGNQTFVLPRGVVCDRCNNYFARKVEKPFLDSQALRHLRFAQAVPNKRGLIPPTTAILDPGHVVTLYKHRDGEFAGVLDVGTNIDTIRALLEQREGHLHVPADPAPPADRHVSRFLAKAAVEAVAHRLLKHNVNLAEMIDDPKLDSLRAHARLGDPKDWQHFARRIYDADRHFQNERGTFEQTIWECDFLFTEKSELFFTLALFGLELTINMGAPEIAGFEQWVECNSGASPLYRTKDPKLRP